MDSSGLPYIVRPSSPPSFASPHPTSRIQTDLDIRNVGLWIVGLLTAAGLPASLEKSGYWVAVAGGAYAVSVWDKLSPQYVILSGAIFGLIYGGVIGAP